MDWSKTKTIFIIVFSILNVFLYSLYLNKYTEAEQLTVPGDPSIDELLKLDSITYGTLPVVQKEASYVSAKITTFKKEDIEELENQKVTIEEETLLKSTLKTPVSIQNSKGELQFSEFLATEVLNGDKYDLWEMDEDARKAVFFQSINGHPVYYNQNALLVLYWNEDGEVTRYEQRMFGEFETFNESKDVLSPMQTINTLYTRNYLPPNSEIIEMTLGYSTLVQLTKTQVFAPTWKVRVQLKDGEIEEYFVNAIEGKIIEFKLDPFDIDEE